MSQPAFTVHGRWDEESHVWWTDGEDVPGLCVQAASFEELADLVFSLAPELLVANGVVAADSGTVALTVVAERRATARLVA